MDCDSRGEDFSYGKQLTGAGKKPTNQGWNGVWDDGGGGGGGVGGGGGWGSRFGEVRNKEKERGRAKKNKMSYVLWDNIKGGTGKIWKGKKGKRNSKGAALVANSG